MNISSEEGYYKDLKERQQEHLKGINNIFNRGKVFISCMHESCPSCVGTGIKKDGSYCVHMISCPCPKCSISC
jgi:hypothetical protein